VNGGGTCLPTLDISSPAARSWVHSFQTGDKFGGVTCFLGKPSHDIKKFGKPWLAGFPSFI